MSEKDALALIVFLMADGAAVLWYFLARRIAPEITSDRVSLLGLGGMWLAIHVFALWHRFG